MVSPAELVQFVNAFHEQWETARRERSPFTLSSYFELNDAARPESRLTSFLLHLLHPNGPHKLGDRPLRHFLELIEVSTEGSFEVQRGFLLQQGIPDIVIERYTDRAIAGVIFIENKPFSPEGYQQLDRYTCALEKRAGERVLVYLPGFRRCRHFSDRETKVKRIVVPYLRAHKPEGDASPTSVEEWFERLIGDVASSQCPEKRAAQNTLYGALDLIRTTFSGGEKVMPVENELRSALERDTAARRKAFEINDAFRAVLESLRTKTLEELSDKIRKAALNELSDGWEPSQHWDGSLADQYCGPSVRNCDWPRNVAAGISSEIGKGRRLIIGVHAPIAQEAGDEITELNKDQYQALRTSLLGSGLERNFATQCRIGKYPDYWPWYLEQGLEDLGDDAVMASLSEPTAREQCAQEYSRKLVKIAKAAHEALRGILNAW